MKKYITKICVLCKSSFDVQDCPSISKKVFCSVTCRNRANASKQIRSNTPCKQCGKQFRPSKAYSETFCSRSCYDEHISIFGTRSKERKALIDYVCEQFPSADLVELSSKLGISLSAIYNIAHKRGLKRSDSALQAQYEIISGHMTDNNPMKRPDVAAKVSEYWKANPEKAEAIRVKATQSNQRDRPSKLELRCAEYLTIMGLDYEHQAIIKDKFVVDFRIGNTILQCDGDYWHGHKRFEPLTERQLKQQKRDAAQDKYLQACGYTVIRVWESDMSLEYLKKVLE